MARRAVIAAMIASTVACSRQRLTVTPTMLHSQVPALRAHGRATVELEPSGSATLSLDDVVPVKLGGETKQLSIASLIASCPDVRPFANDEVTRRKYADSCLLLRTTSPITIDHEWKSELGSVAGIVGGVVVILLVMTVFGYIHECSEPDDGC